jgi:hypothetical protein
MIFFGSVLALNVSAGPCGGTAFAVEPFPAIFVAIFGLELVVCSYLLVKKLKVESDFRVIIYLFLVGWALSLVAPLVGLLRSGMPQIGEDLNDFYFFFASRISRGCKPYLVLSLGRREEHDYQALVIPACSALFFGGTIKDYADFFEGD